MATRFRTKYTVAQTEKMSTYEKLTALADYLEEKVVDKGFDLGSWAYVYDEDDAIEGTLPVGKLTCGTTACACGWATNLFPHLRVCFPYDTLGELLYSRSGRWGENREGPPPSSGFQAAEEFFGVTPSEADNMFLEGLYEDNSRLAVVARIREVAERYK